MFRLAVCAGLLLVMTPASARADGFVTPFIAYGFGGDSAGCAGQTGCGPTRKSYGVSVGVFGASIGFEEDLNYAKDFFGAAAGATNSVLSAMSNVLFLGAAGPVRSYVVSGIGLIRSSVSLLDQPRVVSNVIGYDLGGGANALLTKHVGLRIDVRHFQTLQSVNVPLAGGKIGFWRASLGVALQF